jgi:hypothetical protein
VLLRHCQTLHLRLRNLQLVFFFSRHIYVAFLPTLCVVQYVRTFSIDCRYYDHISILCKPLKYNDAPSHYSVFAHSHVSPSVVDPNVLLRHRQSVFLPDTLHSLRHLLPNGSGHRSHFVSCTFWILFHYRKCGEPFCEHVPKLGIHFEEIISRARGNFETKMRYLRRFQ